MLGWLGLPELLVVEAPANVVYTEYSLAKDQVLLFCFDIFWELWSSRLYG